MIFGSWSINSFTKRLKLSFFARFKASAATCQGALRWSPGSIFMVFYCISLRVSSLVRFYKSRFWFFSENFLKNFWIKFLKYFWKISESRDFLLPTHSKMKETSCFAAIFILFALLFSNFDEFQKFFRKFSENFQKMFRIFSEKFLKNFWNISKKIMNPEIFCCQPFKNEGN